MTKKCLMCGETFTVRVGRNGANRDRHVYCQAKCRVKAYRQRDPKHYSFIDSRPRRRLVHEKVSEYKE